jgi:3-hydroxyacyl-[acyl-carrier-protein] dehydratase
MRLDHRQIRTLLPLRHPMLLVDRVVDLRPGVSIIGTKAVTTGEPCYDGLPEDLPAHRYAYPVSLMLESFGQTAALLWVQGEHALPTVSQRVLMLAALRECRILGRAYPGDVLYHHIQLDQLVHGNAFLSGQTRVGDRVVATMGSLIAVQRPRPAPPVTDSALPVKESTP